MIGLMLHTEHSAPMPCDDTYGVYINHNGASAGIFKNSECNIGAWGAWAPETNTLTLGPVHMKAGLLVGGILGYKEHPIFPLLVPSVAVSLDGRTWVRASYLPKVKTGASGVTFSVEFTF